MKDYAPIACGDYEVLEVVCMDSSEVEIHLEGNSMVGTATGLRIKDRAEYLQLTLKDGLTEEIRVDQIQHLTVLSRPTHIHHHTFN